MQMHSLIKSSFHNILFAGLFLLSGFCYSVTNQPQTTIDRIHLVNQQIDLLHSRLSQNQNELQRLEQQHDQSISGLTVEKITKRVLDKASLDISVAKSNLDSINIELSDTQQIITWLEKGIQEIENQLNVISIFGLKMTEANIVNPKELHSDLNYQQQLSSLEKQRFTLLKNLQKLATNILSLRDENYARINTLLKTRHLLQLKQEQAQDELSYQQQQNFWLQRLNYSYAQLAKIDPINAREQYAAIERDIYYANELANYAYIRSLIARYDDQIQQMKLAILRSNSISVLNEIADQNQILNKQIDKLKTSLINRISVLKNHVDYLTVRKKNVVHFQPYIKNLASIAKKYQTTEQDLSRIKDNLAEFRLTLDNAIQTELSSRQGLPVFGFKTFLDLGKEILLVPTLSFQIVKNFSTSLMQSIKSTNIFHWSVIAVVEFIFLFLYFFIKNITQLLLSRPYKWKDKLNSKWLSLQWLDRNCLDLIIITNIVLMMTFFGIARKHHIIIIYLSLVWMIFKSINIIARLCLVETPHDNAGDDIKLYNRLKWIILIGGLITAITVFVHQLPLIYELKTLCDSIFLLLLMVVSLILLRFYDVVPTLILTHTETNHPYLRKSIRLIGILFPLLLLGNSIMGLFGYLNLIMTVSWYEGLFMIVLIGYLILRGLLSDAMEQVSRLLIQYVNNGWLWTEAFLKPIDKVLRITLFLVAWAVLFILYGWDKQSPIVEQLTQLLHHRLISVLNTTITPLSIIELCVVISIFYWSAKWVREFIYRLLLSRTKDLGIRNSIAILSQYTIVVFGIFICLRVLGIDFKALVYVSSAFAFGIGLGLRDLANNFACGFLILLERPLRVGDIVNINDREGEVMHIGGRAITVRTWDHIELMVPNAEIFNKSFTNLTAKDNTVRSILQIKISRHDNPHEVKVIIQNVLGTHSDILSDPAPEVFLKNMNDLLMEFEIRYYVNIRQVSSRTSVVSQVLMKIWDAFATHGIKPPYPQQEIMLLKEEPRFEKLTTTTVVQST